MVMIKSAIFAAVVALVTVTSARGIYRENNHARRDIDPLKATRYIDIEGSVAAKRAERPAQSYQMINKRQRGGISAEIPTKTDAQGNIILYDPKNAKRDEVVEKRQNFISAEIAVMTDKNGNIIPYGPSKREVKRQDEITGSEAAVKAPNGKVVLYERQNSMPEEVPTKSGPGGRIQPYRRQNSMPEEVPTKSGPGGRIQPY